MKPAKSRTLLWQLGLALMAVQAIVAVVLAAYTVNRLRAFHQERAVRELVRVTPLMADRLEPLLRPDRRAELTATVAAIGRRAGVRMTVIDVDGVVLADSERDPAVMDDHRYRTEIDAAIRTGTGSAVRESTTLGLDMVYHAQRVTDDGAPVAVIRTSRPLDAVNAELAQVLRIIGSAALVSLLFTLGVIYFVSRRLTSTVARLAEGAGRFAAGDLSHRIPHPKTRELGRLADALDHMAVQLSDKLALLQNQRAEQDAIMGSMTSGLLALDGEQRVLSINRAAERVLGVEGGSARGRLLQALVREPELNRFVEAAIAGGVVRDELELQRGTRVEAVSAPLIGVDQQSAGLLVFIDDVTQLRRLESIRSDFAANVSHELRTPITNIRGYAETLLDVGFEDEAQTREFVEIIRRSADRLEAIIEDLLALARLEQSEKRVGLETTRVPVADLVRAAVGQTADAAGAKSITVVADAVAPALAVFGNAQLLEQALANLLSNAINYSPADTQVTVAAEAGPDGTVTMSVTDQGPGIAPRHLARLFERFYRVDQSRSRDVGGTGLGLAIVKHIAIVHGGRAEVDSVLGAGSVFRIIVPGGAGDDDTEATAASPAPMDSDAGDAR